MPPKPVDKEKALERLASLCSKSEQCEADLIRKLFNWGINSSDRKEILDYLRENRFVDDARFAKSFANDKSRFSAWGPFKIRMELMRKKIPERVIKEAVASIPQEVWKEGIMKCASSKAKNLELTGEDGWNNRQKLYRYIISRGFPSSSSSKVVSLMVKKAEESQN